MPTGYTVRLMDGRESFEEFFWRATCAFGAMIHMRETSSDKLIPPPTTSRTGDLAYYTEKEKSAALACEQFKELKPEEQVQVVRTLLLRKQTEMQEALARDLEKNRHLNHALESLARLSPGPEQVEFFTFLNQQLTSSMEPTEYWVNELASVEKSLKDLPQAVTDHQKYLAKDLSFYRERRESAEAKDRNQKESKPQKWLQALNELVPCPDSVCTPEFKLWFKGEQHV